MKEKLKAFFASIGYLLLSLGIQLAVAIIGGIIIGVYYLISNISEITNGEVNFDLLTNDMIDLTLRLTSVFLLISSILTVLSLIIIYKIKKKNYKEELLINRTNKFNIIISVILGFSCWLFNTGALTLISSAGFFSEQFQYTENLLLPLNSGSMVMSLIAIGIVGPFAEEFLFRGIVYNTLKKKISIKWTIIIQAILFGVFHGNLIQGSYAILLGIIFGYVTYKTKSLWTAVIIHSINNLIATIFTYVPTDGLNFILIYILFLIVGIIGITVSLILIKNKNKSNEEIIDLNNINNLS